MKYECFIVFMVFYYDIITDQIIFFLLLGEG